MARLPNNARLWKERAEIDYIGPFVKAWAAFNAWFREEAGTRRDREGLEFVKTRVNPVRAEIIPLLRPRENRPDGRPRPDSEEALELKLMIAELHRFLENYQIEVVRENDVLERITFTSVAIRPRVQLPQSAVSRSITFTVDRQNGQWLSTVTNRAGHVTATIPQADYDEANLVAHPEFTALSATMQAHLRGLYQDCCPRPLSNLFVGDEPPIVAGEFEFRCTKEELFFGLIEVIYALRNSLLHGELQPDERAFRAYEPAYRVVMRFLNCVR
ncbi:hypothetical protein [Glycocaulis sp.]|uniref:hypothetical protein n=1 Tax=Glycocaulis sp. TaxID=1969725 RepID=UPI003F7038A0